MSRILGGFDDCWLQSAREPRICVEERNRARRIFSLMGIAVKCKFLRVDGWSRVHDAMRRLELVDDVDGVDDAWNPTEDGEEDLSIGA